MLLAQKYLVTVARKNIGSTGSQIRLEDVGAEGGHAENLYWDIIGESPELIVVGAHYDSAEEAPGADDNASGVAATLELAHRLAPMRFKHTIRFVLFANEEPPYFQRPGMGSLVHARGCSQRGEQIAAMLSLESIGYYSDVRKSQKYPFLVDMFYPDQGNFVAFVGNLESRSLVRQSIGIFRESAVVSSEGAAFPSRIPGVDWSDHWAFWQFHYPAIMVTDTAPFRNPHYHDRSDKQATIDYVHLAYVTLGVQRVIEALAGRT
jgi:hypothetical protein